MKIKKQIIAEIIILLLIILLLPTISKAASYMEIKEGQVAWTNISVSDAYDRCQELNTKESVLGSDKLEAHLTLNRDWGAVAYLTMSIYGVNDANDGQTSTTGNETGVKDFGKKYTWTAGAHETGLESEPKASVYRQSLITNKSSKYVELLKNNIAENPKGLALNEFGASGNYCSSSWPMLLRTGVLRFTTGFNGYDGYGPHLSITFRPVIWNK